MLSPNPKKSHVWYSIGMVNPGEQHGNLTGQTEERNQAKRNNHTHMVFTYCIRNFVAFTSKTNLNSKTLSPSGPTIKPANTPSQVFNHPCQILRKHVLLGTQCLATSICFKLLIVDIQKKTTLHTCSENVCKKIGLSVASKKHTQEKTARGWEHPVTCTCTAACSSTISNGKTPALNCSAITCLLVENAFFPPLASQTIAWHV